MVHALAEKLGKLLLTRKQSVTVAESCTGGLICGTITEISGSSNWFERGFVVYSNQAKQEMLAVSPPVLENHGAVSDHVVRAMALNARHEAHADWSVAVSGIAGPTGGSPDKPVGLVWFAWEGPHIEQVEHCIFAGDREAVRAQTVQHALARLVNLIEEHV